MHPLVQRTSLGPTRKQSAVYSRWQPPTLTQQLASCVRGSSFHGKEWCYDTSTRQAYTKLRVGTCARSTKTRAAFPGVGDPHHQAPQQHLYSIQKSRTYSCRVRQPCGPALPPGLPKHKSDSIHQYGTRLTCSETGVVPAPN